MTAQPNTARRARLRTATAAVCSLLVAVGGVLLAAPAQAATGGPCAGTAGDLPGGVVLPADGLVVGLLDCSAPAPTGPTARDAATPPAAGSLPTGTPVDPGAGAPAASEPGPTVAPTVSTDTTPSPAPAQLTIHRSSTTVYPAKDGYLDVVRFSVRATSADGALVPLVGEAVLSRGGTVVRTWRLNGTSSVISWNGRVRGAIRPGLYTLGVTATAADGTDCDEDTTVLVLPQHLVRHMLTIRTDVGARSTSAALPKQLIGAYRLGRVKVATRTDAVVRGSAKLVFTGGDGHRKAIRLRDGVHTTGATVLPPGFERVTIRHAWAKGAVRLKSLHAIWTYSTLE